MAANDQLHFMPLDLDTFTGSERFMAGTRLGAHQLDDWFASVQLAGLVE